MTKSITYEVTVNEDGDKFWYLNGKRHREDGPACEWINNKSWYVDDKLHREDGPAIERASGANEWYINGELNREDGPAVEYADGTKIWYINGEKLSEREFNNRMNPVVEMTVAEIEAPVGKPCEDHQVIKNRNKWLRFHLGKSIV